MPIYEYRCEQCNHELEMLQKISDDPAKTCPECGKDSLRKLVSAAAFKLKGTGWYETDFKDKKPKNDGKSSGNNSKSDAKKPADAGTKKPNNSSEGSPSKSKETTKPATSSSDSK